MLLQRFDWTRPIALEPAPFKALAQALSEPSLTSRPWSLRAQSDRGDVQLVLHTLTGDRSLGTALKAGPHAQGVAIFRPRPDDNLASAAQGLAQRHNGAARLEDRFLLPASMSGARAGQRLAALDRKAPRVDDGKVNSTDPSGARQMWVHHGPSTPTTLRDPRASDRPPG